MAVSPCSAISTTSPAIRLPRPNTLLIDSEQLEAGDALDDNFRGMAKDEIERFRREIVERTGDARAAENITDQELLREVMNTVGKAAQLGGSVRCVVSVSMLTEGWDANTVTHVLGIRAFGTQLLCEQVIGRALRRQSYDLNDEGLFDVEYADIFGIPFDFTAKPVIAPPQPPRETIQVKALPERAALEIRFPRVEGYRVELPEERLTADFNDDSILVLSPDLVGPSITRNSGIIGEAVDMSLKHLDDMRSVVARVQRHAQAALHEMARSRRGAEAASVWSAEADHQAVDRYAAWFARARPIRALLMYQELADMACNRITAAITRQFLGERPIKALLDPYNPTGSTRARAIQHVARRPLGNGRAAAEEPRQLGHPRQRLGRRILPRRRIPSAGDRLHQEPQPRPRGALPLRLGDAEISARLHRPGR